MAVSTGRAPRGTRALVSTIMDALEDIPEVSRKAAFRHASATVREKLIAQSERAKAAARRAPRTQGAKVAARRAPRTQGAKTAAPRAPGTRGAKRAAAAAGIARSPRRR